MALSEQERKERCKEYKRKSRQRRIDAGICVRCGMLPATNGALCHICATRRNAYNKQTHELYKKMGICVYCHKNDSMKGKNLCSECQEKLIKKQKEKRAERNAQGLCPICGKKKLNLHDYYCVDCWEMKCIIRGSYGYGKIKEQVNV